MHADVYIGDISVLGRQMNIYRFNYVMYSLVLFRQMISKHYFVRYSAAATARLQIIFTCLAVISICTHL